MLHTRDMLPPVRELIEEQVTEVVETPSEPIYERDEQSGVLVRVGKTPGGKRTVTTQTGRLVESFETIGDDGRPILHEGSMKQVDLSCHDCGSLLKPANDRDFYYLLCSRLNERNHAQFQRLEERGDEVDGKPVAVTVLRTWDVPSEEPYENCVLECDNEPREEPA